MISPIRFVLICTIGLFAASQFAAAQTYIDVEFPGNEAIYPLGVNCGMVVGIYYDAEGAIHGFSRSRLGNYESIDVPAAQGGFGTYPVGIDDQQSIAGYYYDANYASHGFVMSHDGTFTIINIPGASPVYGTTVVSISGDGTILGFYTDDADTDHAFRRSRSGRITRIDIPGSAATWAESSNYRGNIVGYYQEPNVGSKNGSVHGFIMAPDGSYIQFDRPPSEDIGPGFPTVINDEDSIVTTYVDAQNHSHGLLRFCDGQFKTIDYPGSNYSELLGIDDNGIIAGGYLDSSGNNHGFLRFRNGNLLSFDFPGASVADTTVRAASTQGEVVGTWSDLYGAVHGFARLPD
jgi:hypothetical protein